MSDVGEDGVRWSNPSSVGDQRRQPHPATGGQRAWLQGSVGQQRGRDLAGHQRTPATLEWLPDIGRPQVAEGGERTSDGGGQGTCRTSSEPHRSRDSVRTVGMSVRSHLLLFPPLGPSVLEPNLKEGEFYIFDGGDNFSKLGLTDMLSSLWPHWPQLTYDRVERRESVIIS